MSEAEAVVEPVVDTALPSEWVNSLPEQFKDAPFFRPTKDGSVRSPDEVLSALENAAKLQGNLSESHIRIPAPDASDEDKQAARERILSTFGDLREVVEGEDSVAPTEVSGYKVPEIEGFDAAGVEDIAKFALEHKWGQKQFEDYVTQLADGQKSAADTQSVWESDQAKKINDALGLAKDEHMGRVVVALSEMGAPDGFIESLKAGKIDADVVLALDKLVHKVVDMGDEGSQFVQQVNHGARQMTPDEHKERAGELWRKLHEMNNMDPQYKILNQKRMEHIELSMSR